MIRDLRFMKFSFYLFFNLIISILLVTCMQENSRSDPTRHILEILVVHGADGEDPEDVSIYQSIILEDKEMLPWG